MTKPLTEESVRNDAARRPHRRLKMTLLILGAAVSVLSWLAVLIWNGCVSY